MTHKSEKQLTRSRIFPKGDVIRMINQFSITRSEIRTNSPENPISKDNKAFNIFLVIRSVKEA
jgi:hypothetical protein